MASRHALSRSVLAAARSSPRSPAPVPRQNPASLAAPRLGRGRRLPFAAPRPVAALALSQSLIPLHSVVAAARLTSYLSANARACFELSQGTFCRTCQDR